MPSDAKPEDGTKQYDPEKDPFACGICGVYLNESDRVTGRDYCPDCRSEGAGGEN